MVIRRIFNGTDAIERGETTLEHGCLSCTVRLDLVPAVARLLKEGCGGTVIIGLPPAVPAAAAVSALNRGLKGRATISSALLACAPDALEDHIWDSHTLFESGFTPVADDERTPGEFLLGELAFADTVLLAEPDIVPADPAGRRRGLHLIRELAPHADIAPAPAAVRPGLHRLAEAVARTAPGTVHACRPQDKGASSPFTTAVKHVEGPLHPGRFRQALGILAAGCCVLRGHLWVASAPDCRIAIQGIGPRVWLENVGRWTDGRPGREHTDSAPPAAATVISAVGEDLDPGEFERLLQDCELTDAELASGGTLHDPFGLRPAGSPPAGHTTGNNTKGGNP